MRAARRAGATMRYRPGVGFHNKLFLLVRRLFCRVRNRADGRTDRIYYVIVIERGNVDFPNDVMQI